jgi:hypothetical protein
VEGLHGAGWNRGGIVAGSVGEISVRVK